VSFNEGGYGVSYAGFEMSEEKDYSGTPLAKKLGIKAGARVAFVNPPVRFEEDVAPLPPGVEQLSLRAKDLNVIVVFAKSRYDLADRMDTAVRHLAADGGLWLSWPKPLSGYTTDLQSNVAQAIGLATGLVDNKVASFNDAWTGMRFVVRVTDRDAWSKRSFD